MQPKFNIQDLGHISLTDIVSYRLISGTAVASCERKTRLDNYSIKTGSLRGKTISESCNDSIKMNQNYHHHIKCQLDFFKRIV